MPNNQISTQTTFGNAVSFIKEKAIPFIKQGLLIPFIFATLLYILMRVFFIGSEFDINESVELYAKTFLVTWAYINAFRLICYGIIWVEARSTKATFAKVISLPVLKKTAILIIVAGLTYTVKARSVDEPVKNNSVESLKAESDNNINPTLFSWMK